MSEANEPASTNAETGATPPPPPVPSSPNPLWSLVLPGLGLLAVGTLVVCYLIPFLQDVSTMNQKYEKMRSEWARSYQYQYRVQPPTPLVAPLPFQTPGWGTQFAPQSAPPPKR
jgi:hypothetical protein